jgi:hypothetical protein
MAVVALHMANPVAASLFLTGISLFSGSLCEYRSTNITVTILIISSAKQQQTYIDHSHNITRLFRSHE